MNIKIKLSFLFCHIFSKVFYMWINGAPVCLYCSKPFVSYPLVVSYPQQCHIGTNENYLCAIIISTHMLVFEISHSKTLSNFNKLQPQLYLIQNKQIDYIRNIMSKCLHVFITSFSAFFLKCSKNQRLKFQFERLQKIIFWRLYTCNIVATSKSDFKHLKILYNLHPIKQTF